MQKRLLLLAGLPPPCPALIIVASKMPPPAHCGFKNAHCGFKSNSEGMKIHEKTCRQKEVIEKTSLKSEEKDDDSKNNIIVNNENQSPSSSYLICKKCDSVFNSRFSLDNHEKNCKKSNILLSGHKPRKIFYDGLPKPGKWVVKLEKVDVS